LGGGTCRVFVILEIKKKHSISLGDILRERKGSKRPDLRGLLNGE
jgi:hypothetical protein